MVLPEAVVVTCTIARAPAGNALSYTYEPALAPSVAVVWRGVPAAAGAAPTASVATAIAAVTGIGRFMGSPETLVAYRTCRVAGRRWFTEMDANRMRGHNRQGGERIQPSDEVRAVVNINTRKAAVCAAIVLGAQALVVQPASAAELP